MGCEEYFWGWLASRGQPWHLLIPSGSSIGYEIKPALRDSRLRIFFLWLMLKLDSRFIFYDLWFMIFNNCDEFWFPECHGRFLCYRGLSNPVSVGIVDPWQPSRRSMIRGASNMPQDKSAVLWRSHNSYHYTIYSILCVFSLSFKRFNGSGYGRSRSPRARECQQWRPNLLESWPRSSRCCICSICTVLWVADTVD